MYGILGPTPVMMGGAKLDPIRYIGHAEIATTTYEFSFPGIDFGVSGEQWVAFACIQARDVFLGRVYSVEFSGGGSFYKCSELSAPSGHVEIWMGSAGLPPGEQTINIEADGDLVCCGIDIYAVDGTGLVDFATGSTASNNSEITLSGATHWIGCSSQASGATCTVIGGIEDSDRTIRSSYLNGCAAHGTGNSATFNWSSGSSVRSCAFGLIYE